MSDATDRGIRLVLGVAASNAWVATATEAGWRTNATFGCSGFGCKATIHRCWFDGGLLTRVRVNRPIAPRFSATATAEALLYSSGSRKPTPVLSTMSRASWHWLRIQSMRCFVLLLQVCAMDRPYIAPVLLLDRCLSPIASMHSTSKIRSRYSFVNGKSYHQDGLYIHVNLHLWNPQNWPNPWQVLPNGPSVSKEAQLASSSNRETTLWRVPIFVIHGKAATTVLSSVIRLSPWFGTQVTPCFYGFPNSMRQTVSSKGEACRVTVSQHISINIRICFCDPSTSDGTHIGWSP